MLNFLKNILVTLIVWLCVIKLIHFCLDCLYLWLINGSLPLHFRMFHDCSWLMLLMLMHWLLVLTLYLLRVHMRLILPTQMHSCLHLLHSKWVHHHRSSHHLRSCHLLNHLLRMSLNSSLFLFLDRFLVFWNLALLLF